MIVTFPPEVEQKIIALAAQRSVDPATFVASLVVRELGEQDANLLANGGYHDDACDLEAGNRAVAAPLNRAPGQSDAAQEGLLREGGSGLALPPGVTGQDMMDALSGSAEDDLDALQRAAQRITNRTPEEKEAMRQSLLKAIPEPLPIPAGKTVFDMFFRIRGDETEAQVYEALQRLS